MAKKISSLMKATAARAHVSSLELGLYAGASLFVAALAVITTPIAG